MINTLEYCFRNNKVSSFYFDKEDNQKHLTGFVHCYNENELLIAHITPRGDYDGYILNRLDSLYRVDYDGEYERKISLLYKLKNQSHPKVNCDEEGILFTLLDFAKKNDYYVSAELENENVTGIVNVVDDFIHLNVVKSNGEKNGMTILDIDEVVTFSCDTDYEQDINLITKNK